MLPNLRSPLLRSDAFGAMASRASISASAYATACLAIMSAAHPSGVMSACIAKFPRREETGLRSRRMGVVDPATDVMDGGLDRGRVERCVRSFEIREPRQRKVIAAGPLTPARDRRGT